MAKQPHRIDYSLLSEDLKALLNAKWDIHPMALDDIANDYNPNNFEYVRPVEALYNHRIYRWDVDHFELIGAEADVVAWGKITGKPETYPPSTHTHSELHTHNNKAILDAILTEDITNWNSILTHEQNTTVHITSNERLSWDGTITDLEALDSRVTNIESGHSAAHAHTNLAVLDTLTATDITLWNSVSSKVDATDLSTALSGKVDSTTFLGHTGNTTVHITSDEREAWNAKPSTDTTYSVFSLTKDGLVPKTTTANTTDYLRRDGSWATPPDTNTVYTHPAHNAQTSGLYKITVDNEGHISAVVSVAKEDITALGIPAQDTTYSVFAKSADGLVPKSDQNSDKFLKGDGTWATPPDTNTIYTHPTTAGNKHIPSGGSTGQILGYSADGTAKWVSDKDTTYGTFNITTDGLVPKSGEHTDKFLKGDGTWGLPTGLLPASHATSHITSGTDEIPIFTATKSGLTPAVSTSTDKFLKGDGTWATPTDTVYTHPTTAGNKHIPTGGTVGQILGYDSSGTAKWIDESNTTYGTFNATTDGLVPKSSTNTDKFLKGDGTWNTPTNTVYTHPTTSGNKHIPAGGSANKILGWDSDGTAKWVDDKDTVYTHPSNDGDLHVPATGTTNNGKVLKAGSTAKSISWGSLSASDVGAAASSHTHTKSQISDFPTIPTSTNDLTNNSGFITSADAGTKITQGTTKPSLGFWFKEVV